MQSDVVNKSHAPLVIGAICARGGSKGLPRKNLRHLAGRPLIAHTIQCAKASLTLQRVVVSTEDEEIADVALRYGAEVPFMRPEYLAQDDSSKWDVFRHLVKTIEETEGLRVGILADLDTGVPLRQPCDIDACVEKLLNEDLEVVITAYEAERNPYFNMVELDSSGCAHISKLPARPIVGRQNAPRVYSLTPAVYAIRREALRQREHWSVATFTIHVVPRERAIDIDTEIDLVLVKCLMKHKRLWKQA